MGHPTAVIASSIAVRSPLTPVEKGGRGGSAALRASSTLWLVLLSCAGACLAPARAEVAVPPLQSRVTDLTATLSPSRKQALEQKLAAFEARKGSQVAVLIVPSTKPETIEQYGIRVAEQWKLGRKGVDDGALLLVAKEDRALRIEVGYGLEGPLPDATAKRIIEEVIVPRFRSGDFEGGVDAGTDAVIKVIEGEPLPAPPRRDARGGGNSPFDTALVIGFMLVAVVGTILRSP